MYSDFSTLSNQVDNILLFVLSISVILLVGITFCMIYFVIKYNKKRHPEAVKIPDNIKLEITWTVIPTILVLLMFYYGWEGFRAMRTVPPGSMVINVIGRMWNWTFQYDNGKETNILYVPVNKPVKLVMTSRDVVHSLYIPAFRIKADTVPGMQTYEWFQANKEETYDIMCAEYCGTSHSAMITKLIVMSENDFNKWYKSDIPPEVTEAHPGEKILMEKACMTCHSRDGTVLVGPTFKGIYGKKIKVMTDGNYRKILVDEDYLRRSIIDPQADIVLDYEGTKMPPAKEMLTDKEINDIVNYIKELK